MNVVSMLPDGERRVGTDTRKCVAKESVGGEDVNVMLQAVKRDFAASS